MARRSIERTLLDLLLSGVGIALIALATAIVLVREYPLQILTVAVSVFAGWWFWKRQRHQRRLLELQRATEHTDAQIEQYRSALISYYRQSLRRDQFGNEDTRVWNKWIATFVERQVGPELARARIVSSEDLLTSMGNHVDRRIRAIAQLDDVGETASATGQEYERQCASILFRRGWTVHPTPATGDNGADVIAEKGDARLIVQCKLYSQPVGNKAVQEAYSARHLFHGTHACVVAPNGFTAQAERAAHGLSVRLIHHSQLEAYADELSAELRSKKRVVR